MIEVRLLVLEPMTNKQIEKLKKENPDLKKVRFEIRKGKQYAILEINERIKNR